MNHPGQRGRQAPASRRGGGKAVLVGAMLAVVAVLAAVVGAGFLFYRGVTGSPPAMSASGGAPLRTMDLRTGSRYLPPPKNPFQAPLVRELQLPPFADATSVWGATGRDDAGAIWVGVSASHDGMSAHLMRYDPAKDQWQDQGAVVQQLQSAGLHTAGAGQDKIHSKIVPADDGKLYFTSMDEEGESASNGVNPRWGGHLWRVDPQGGAWQHLLAAPEALVAVAAGGRYIYALGYWGHMLYQYDSQTGTIRKLAVGAPAGHISRNLLADGNGHVYVPRVLGPEQGGPRADLVEYDERLQVVAATPMEHYFGKEKPAGNHGIVGLAYLADGRIVFTTHTGYLYAIQPAPAGAAKLMPVGWFHPDGESYASSLFTFTGGNLLAGVASRDGQFKWVVFDLATRHASAFDLDLKDLRNVLLYGSVTRDNAGRFYVGGWASKPGGGGKRPLVLQVSATP